MSLPMSVGLVKENLLSLFISQTSKKMIENMEVPLIFSMSCYASFLQQEYTNST